MQQRRREGKEVCNKEEGKEKGICNKEEGIRE